MKNDAETETENIETIPAPHSAEAAELGARLVGSLKTNFAALSFACPWLEQFSAAA